MVRVMAKYIEREAILDLLKNKYQDMSAMPASYYKGSQYALKTIEKIKPAADVAPVVRCKDCKTYSNGSCWIMRGKMKPYDFCNYGERGEE